MILPLIGLAVAGKLFLAGGGTTPPELVDRYVAETGASGRIIVLPLASENPAKSGPPSVELLTEHGAKNVVLWAKADPTDADRLELSELLKGAKGIWMAGGDQRRITARLGSEFITKTLQPLVKHGLNVYGTSAGAMACSATMITGNGNLPGTATMAPGLGLTNWIVDTHFTQRGRLPRLQDALRQSCATAGGLGIDEKSWVVIRGDQVLERHGAITLVPVKKD